MEFLGEPALDISLDPEIDIRLGPNDIVGGDGLYGISYSKY
jgi:hypothetical protein